MQRSDLDPPFSWHSEVLQILPSDFCNLSKLLRYEAWDTKMLHTIIQNPFQIGRFLYDSIELAPVLPLARG
jgi:hypothetical protein